jgi:hypothetical protein
LIWYSGSTGLLAAAVPWLVRSAKHMERATSINAAETRFALLFFFTGLVSGFVYWLIAGRDAGRRS